MVIGEKLRTVREAAKLSQRDIETRTGFLRCYVSRVENGHTVPSLPTLEKFAQALEIPLYQLFYDGDGPALAEFTPVQELRDGNRFGKQRRDVQLFARFRRFLARTPEHDRKLLLLLAEEMTSEERDAGIADQNAGRQAATLGRQSLMADLQVTCINKPNRMSSHEHITHIGNSANNWRMTREEAIRRIERNTDSFYTIDTTTGSKVAIGVYREAGKVPFLRTHADGKWNDNLLALDECSATLKLY